MINLERSEVIKRADMNSKRREMHRFFARTILEIGKPAMKWLKLIVNKYLHLLRFSTLKYPTTQI